MFNKTSKRSILFKIYRSRFRVNGLEDVLRKKEEDIRKLMEEKEKALEEAGREINKLRREVETVTARVDQGVQSDSNSEEDRETEQRCDLRNCCNIL